LEQLIDRAGRRGLLILLDMHKLEEDMPTPPELWYSQGRSYNQFQQGWVNLVRRYL
jgi:aryl-phospho-beta-D-glucosidase BglC (GH1 family)